MLGLTELQAHPEGSRDEEGPKEVGEGKDTSVAGDGL